VTPSAIRLRVIDCLIRRTAAPDWQVVDALFVRRGNTMRAM
jgi:hypothetical protein